MKDFSENSKRYAQAFQPVRFHSEVSRQSLD
jgi:hypothetical protein